jgi:acyl-CoA synthetase (AMP-forming)/AMP-acid ligase II
MRSSSEERIRDHRGRGWWSDRRMTDMFDAAVQSVPDRMAVVDPPNREALTGDRPKRLTFAALSDLVDGYALRFLALGLRRDDILITQLPNITDYVAVHLAAGKLGIVLSPVPMQFRRHELEQILAQTGARAALTVRAFKGVEYASSVAQLGAERDFRVLCLGGDPVAGTSAFTPERLDAGASESLRRHIESLAISADDLVTICWTSGTEGAPKGVPRSHNLWLSMSYGHLKGARLQPGDRLLNPFPLVNMAAIGGCYMSWLHIAGTLVLHHPLDLPVYLQQIAEERPEYAIAPPAILNLLLKDPKLLEGVDLSCLRCIGSGSAPLDPAMIRGYRDRFGIEIANMFGSNEGVTLHSNASYAPEPERRARFFPRFGRPEIALTPPCPSVIETRVMDPESGEEILEAERPGELQIRGPTVFDGYFRAPELTAKAFTADGFFRTGDLFQIAGNPGDLRFYQFMGRLRQIINRGGVKISPEELDDVLGQHPKVIEGAVVSYPDPVMGEKICAVVVLRPGETLTLESLREHFAASGLAAFKRPERLRVIAQLPRNAVGKVIRSELTPLAEQPDAAPNEPAISREAPAVAKRASS